jgi:hypothetical protein
MYAHVSKCKNDKNKMSNLQKFTVSHHLFHGLLSLCPVKLRKELFLLFVGAGTLAEPLRE